MSEACKTPCLVFRTKDDVLKDPLWTVATGWTDTLEEELSVIIKVWGSVPWLAGPEVTEGEIEVPGYPPFRFGTIQASIEVSGRSPRLPEVSYDSSEVEVVWAFMECEIAFEKRKDLRYESVRVVLEGHDACTARALAFFSLLSYVATALATAALNSSCVSSPRSMDSSTSGRSNCRLRKGNRCARGM